MCKIINCNNIHRRIQDFGQWSKFVSLWLKHTMNHPRKKSLSFNGVTPLPYILRDNYDAFNNIYEHFHHRAWVKGCKLACTVFNKIWYNYTLSPIFSTWLKHMLWSGPYLNFAVRVEQHDAQNGQHFLGDFVVPWCQVWQAFLHGASVVKQVLNVSNHFQLSVIGVI